MLFRLLSRWSARKQNELSSALFFPNKAVKENSYEIRRRQGDQVPEYFIRWHLSLNCSVQQLNST